MQLLHFKMCCDKKCQRLVNTFLFWARFTDLVNKKRRTIIFYDFNKSNINSVISVNTNRYMYILYTNCNVVTHKTNKIENKIVEM